MAASLALWEGHRSFFQPFWRKSQLPMEIYSLKVTSQKKSDENFFRRCQLKIPYI